MVRTSIARFAKLLVVAAVALAACSQPSPTPDQPAPEITPEIVVEFNPPATPGPSPTPRPLGNPIVVDRSPLQGEELPPDAPIRLTFDQPMDRGSVEAALRVTDASGAAVPGDAAWTSDNVVEFQPAAPWVQATRYAVALGEQAQSARGLALAKPVAFTVNTIGALAVAQTIPADGAEDVGADATITVLFNRPVVSLTTLAEQAALPQPVTFDPPITGAGQWLNTSIYLFQPSAPLAAGTIYRGVVAAGLRDTAGALLESDYAWSFGVAAPAVKFITPAPGGGNVDLRQPISVTFSQKMDRASAEAAFAIDPPVAGAFRWADEEPPQDGPGVMPAPEPRAAGAPGPTALAPALGEVMAFVPGEDYRRGQTYAVVIRAGAKAAAGSGATAAETRTTFKVIPLPAVVSTRPSDGDGRADPGIGLAIRFSAPMSVATIIPNLRIDPPVSLTNVYTYYDESSNEFNINVRWQPSTAYRLRIGGDITDRYGVAIGDETDVRFSTGPLAPFVALQTNGLVGTYNAAVQTELFGSYRNVTRIDLELSALTPEQLHRLTGAPNSYEALRTYKPAEGELLRAWAIQTDGALNESKNVRLELTEGGGALPTGIYLLSASAPELIALDRNFTPNRHILVVTDLHITQKRGDRDGLAWVTDLNTGQPAAGLSASFRDQNFAEIATGVTSGDPADAGQALVTFPSSYRPYNLLYTIVGQPGSTFGVAWSEMSQGINIYDFNLPGRYQAEPYFAYLYTDRPIYRPGQMVFYKGIVRADDDARFAISDRSSVNVTIANMQGQQVFSQSLPLSATGAFTGQFALDTGAATGQYYLQACVPLSNPSPNEAPCSYYGVPFQVAAYRAPEFEVSLTTDKADYLDGETINASLDVKYFFGGNVANAKVQWVLLVSDYYFDRYKGPGSYAFGDSDPLIGFGPFGPGFNTPIANGEGVTDAQGQLTISVPADLSKRAGSATFTLEASVTDVNDQSVSARTSAVVHKGQVYFGVATDAFVYTAGDEVAANVISVDWNGAPVPNKAGAVSFSTREWFTTQEQDQFGNLFYTSVPSDTEVFSATITTDAEGKAVASYAPQAGGELRIKAAGEGAVPGATSVYVSAGDAYVAWRVENNDRIELKADKAAYQVGETARVLVPSPFQGATQALLTIERGNFLDRRTITLNSNSDILDIPITPAFAPNAYVSVLIVKGVDAANPVPAYRLGYTRFAVAPTQFELKVDIKPDKAQYAPREAAVYDIRVTDAAGNPVQAELSLALVDKAVLSLTDPNALPILDAFYGERPLSVRTADTLSVNVDRITERVAAAEAKGGGGGGDAGAETSFTRQNFKDTAYWNAVVDTDANGFAQVQVTLPDNLTTWVMSAKAFTPDTRVGQGTNEVLSTKLLLVRPVTPRFFVVGDQVTLGAVVNNNTTAAIDADVAIASTGLVLTGGDAVQRVNVPAGGTARVDWNVSVLDAPSAEITMTVSGGGLFDSAQPGTPPTAEGEAGGVPILRYVAPEVVATAGDLDAAGKKTELIALPPRLDTGQGDLTVRVDTGLGAAAAESVKALEAYPYESVDWAASRLLTNLALARANGTTPNADDVTSALQRMYGAQNADGGWGWWEGGLSDAFISAHVTQALDAARAAGFVVDDGVLSRANDYLGTQYKAAADLATASEANRQAYLLFVQAEGGKGDSGRIGALYEQRAKLGHDGRALLAMALEKVNPGDARVKTLLADLESAAVPSTTGVMWQELAPDWANFGSNTRSTAIVLQALARLDSGNALAVNAVRWLMAARSGAAWHSTQETEWAISAFAEFIQATNEAASNFAWRAALNDQALLSGQADPRGESQSTVIAVRDLLRDQANQLDFERGAGDGRMYYTAHLRAFLPADEAPAVNRGLVIARKYELADCAPTIEAPCEAITSAKIGENVRVRLTLVVPNDVYYVRVTDPLPGGGEAIDASLKTSQTVGPGGLPTAPAFGDARGWGWWWFVRSEVYDDRVAAFASYLPAGTYEYTYTFRPSIAGQFKATPASAELQYFPEVFGRSAGEMFEIER